jgi:hypothetical protein
VALVNQIGLSLLSSLTTKGEVSMIKSPWMNQVSVSVSLICHRLSIRVRAKAG